jgi:formate--tetrahydrofolate ligase
VQRVKRVMRESFTPRDGCVGPSIREPRPITEIAERLGLREDEIDLYGTYKAKLHLSALERRRHIRPGRLVLVTAMTPTPHGEGKTTTAIGLADGLRRIGLRAAVTVRQPTLGPVFGIKGGGSGSGRARILPSEEMDLHLTGDAYAVGAAHNLASAVLDSHLHHGSCLAIDTGQIYWPRVTDHNDRALRRARIAIGDPLGERDAEWVITSASEVMAILALATSLTDLRGRLGRTVVARSMNGSLVTLEDLRVAGAMAALLRDALQPNLLQTAEGSPAFVHAGPFANIAHGCSSVLADELALRLNDIVVTEAGFGSELGAEKFFDIKCRISGLDASAAVIVATTRALALHGSDNLSRHVAILRHFGVPICIAINAFPDDSDVALDRALREACASGADAARVVRQATMGADGAVDLAEAVAKLTEGTSERSHQSGLLYSDELPLLAKIERIACELYGAGGVELTDEVRDDLRRFEADGFGRLPVCVAKTPLSLSHDPARRGVPCGYSLPITHARLHAGAGFVTVFAGHIQELPGLPTDPAGAHIDIAADGTVTGLR